MESGGTIPKPLFIGLVAALLYVCFFCGLDALGLVGPDEPRYASVARTMTESGDWITPRLDGEPWFEKPPLYYWGAALAFRGFGVNETAARLPSALAAALAVLALGWVARRFYGALAAQATLLIVPTSVGVFSFARAATPDMLFSAWLAMAMVAAARLLFDPPRGWPLQAWRVVLGISLGLAALAKGPAALMIAGGSILLWALATRRWRDALDLAHPMAVVAFAAVALPWYVACELRNPGFLLTFLVSQNIERYLTPVFGHEQPVWYFGGILPPALMPWTPLLVVVARDASSLWRRRAWATSASFFFGCWAFFPIVFFSFSRSKLPGYILPGLTPLVLLMAHSISRAPERRGRLPQWALAGVGLTWAALAAVAVPLLQRLLPVWIQAHSTEIATASATLAMAGLTVAVVGLFLDIRFPLFLTAFLMVALLTVLTGFVLPQLDSHLSPRLVARFGIQAELAGERVYTYKLHRAWRYGMNYYLGHPVASWNPELKQKALVCTNTDGVVELTQKGVRVEPTGAGGEQAYFVWVLPKSEAREPE